MAYLKQNIPRIGQPLLARSKQDSPREKPTLRESRAKKHGADQRQTIRFHEDSAGAASEVVTDEGPCCSCRDFDASAAVAAEEAVPRWSSGLPPLRLLTF